MPFSVSEALACKLPVIAYNIPAIYFNYHTPAVIKVKIGSFNDFSNKVIEILKNKKYLIFLKSKAFNFVKKYTWDNVTKTEARTIKEFIKEDN